MQPLPGRMLARMPGSSAPAGRPVFRIEIRDGQDHLLLILREESGMLVAEGDESCWDEAAKRFLHAMMRWSGQVGIGWRDEVMREAVARPGEAG